MTYADTSFLISLYTLDANSAAAAAYVRSAAAPFPLTPFGRLELINSIHLRHFRGEIALAESKAALADLASDLAAGVFSPIPTPPAMYERAQSLISRRTALLGARGVDIVHVAAALEIHAESFLTFDRLQSRLARAEGLATPVRIR